ncbi:MAG: condensation domain-containing protein, partial [Thermoanaerobaculia bacterium]
MKSELADKDMTASLSREAQALLDQRAKALGEKTRPVTKRRSGSGSRLSFAQEAIWLSTELDKSTSVFNRSLVIRLTGHLDCEVLKQTLREIARRHEILRSRVAMIEGEPTFEVLPETTVDVLTVDVSTALRPAINEEIRKPFDLYAGPFIRAVNFAEDELTHTICITTHHIASDGWSDGVFFRELNSIYSAFIGGISPSLTGLPNQYSEFAEWQRERTSGPEIERNVEYWTNRMAGAPLRQNIPADRPRPRMPEMAAGEVRRRIPTAIAHSLEALARSEGATAAITML